MSEPVIAADGRPLKASLNRALRRQKMRALALIAPLLIFILVSFVMPIADMLFRSVENEIVSETLPRTVAALDAWDAGSGETPDEDVFNALYTDMALAVEYKSHTRLGSRLNYETTGIASLFRKSGRRVGKFDTDVYTKAFQDADPRYADPQQWVAWMADDSIRAKLPMTTSAYDDWAKMIVEAENDVPSEEEPWDFVYSALYNDAVSGAELPVSVDVSGITPVSLRTAFGDIDDKWLNPNVWRTIKTYSPRYTDGYFLNSVDLMKGAEGVEARPENEQIYITLFIRTMIMSLSIMGMCVLLGYPIAWLLANLKDRTANLLMILVLLPFWTSLLVRTSAWKVLLQQQGVINDILVWIGIVADDNRLELINNQTGTIIAMTHILLPFMILPLYSVMKTIPPSYLRAAKSLGATNWTAFWRVYFPQSVPGIGAGCILVFILAIGYYITPELVGGTKGVFISNRIAYHISSSLNWGLAAALGTILLTIVMVLYWVYDKIVGIDNVKLGG
ncbi:ABC transporter permease [Sulfitobacter sp. M57]|uniref:ABC transporter permease n=1 Tax=unclassified Sulfitobacter TaxID=196795 RepID=UPI0023E19771|nr:MULTISPECIES: ABC transporter permease [unclassified Sulfitobacter]MDF3415494.1 ABC transporter permease [Sulfitobacter sp. KE5]MDF3422975.1 ABC transporter permease [Sulfitobacter sp. KE43]MDF3434040.1 ABC transporter permease [Sulfitobacter sp. KE42]MDF3459927.1 ABC transporter permease [Sulfitobacter sp. S74]MDF3463579.1 ABC transporter permease [Sulfitobacter sp. Ks18]